MKLKTANLLLGAFLLTAPMTFGSSVIFDTFSSGDLEYEDLAYGIGFDPETGLGISRNSAITRMAVLFPVIQTVKVHSIRILAYADPEQEILYSLNLADNDPVTFSPGSVYETFSISDLPRTRGVATTFVSELQPTLFPGSYWIIFQAQGQFMEAFWERRTDLTGTLAHQNPLFGDAWIFSPIVEYGPDLKLPFVTVYGERVNNGDNGGGNGGDNGGGNGGGNGGNSEIPEPSAVLLSAAGLGALAWLRRRR